MGILDTENSYEIFSRVDLQGFVVFIESDFSERLLTINFSLICCGL